jgi:hypothetical protein
MPSFWHRCETAKSNAQCYAIDKDAYSRHRLAALQAGLIACTGFPSLALYRAKNSSMAETKTSKTSGHELSSILVACRGSRGTSGCALGAPCSYDLRA